MRGPSVVCATRDDRVVNDALNSHPRRKGAERSLFRSRDYPGSMSVDTSAGSLRLRKRDDSLGDKDAIIIIPEVINVLMRLRSDRSDFCSSIVAMRAAASRG